jgi:hypothetical protein
LRSLLLSCCASEFTMDRHMSGEKLPILEEHEDDITTDPEKGTTTIRKSNTTIELPSGASIRGLTEEEITEKLENILIERVDGGSKLACFQLGQLYFEQVIVLYALPWNDFQHSVMYLLISCESPIR